MNKLMLCLVAASLSVFAASMTFEVASVKVSNAPDAAVLIAPGTMDPTSGRLRVPAVGGTVTMKNWTLASIVAAAFDLGSGQFSGPDWMSGDRFDIVAKAPVAATSAELKQMLQALLAERFHLRYHMDTKQLPMFALVIAKGGPKLRAATGDQQSPVLFAPPARLIGRGSTLQSLALVLRRAAGRTVIDKTGLSGTFDFSLSYPAETDGSAPADAAAPIFAAIQEQLGLKLEPQKSQVEVFVVDHADRVPTEN